MSFAYKILNPSDITISPYTANKLYTFASSSLTEYGIVVYSGEYDPIINVSCSDGVAEQQVPCNPYNPENDTTSNGYARRLIYDSIQKLYYQSFISGGFSNVLWTSSSYENYLQTALTSGSNYLTNIRVFGQDSGSGGSPYGGGIYESGSYPSDPSLIRVISIPQDVFGSGIKPGTFEISSSNYLIQDDGQGNLMDNKSISSSLYEGTPYVANVYGGTTDRQGIHVGNIIYSHGMVVITNEDYFCFYPSEPVAQNNSYQLLNVNPSKSLDVLNNDFDDCNQLDTGSLSTIAPLSGFLFPNNTSVNGIINIDPVASNLYQVTPGLYKGYYSVTNSVGVPSNYATVSLELYASPLQLNIISYTSGCFGTVTSQSVTYSINYGVPPYSYSLNETTSWDGIANLYQPTQSLPVAPTTNTIYIKDAIGEIVSQSVANVLGPITYTITTSSIECVGGTGEITVVTASNDFPVEYSIDNAVWGDTYPHSFTTSSGTYNIYFRTSGGCTTTSSNYILDDPDPISATIYLFQGDCTDPSVGNVGAISMSISGGVPPYSFDWYRNGSPLIPNQDTPTPVGLDTGSYYVIVSDEGGGCNDVTSNTINLTTSDPISPFTATVTNVTCYGNTNGQIQFQFGGGSGSILGQIYSGSNLLTSSGYVATSPAHTLTVTGLATGSIYSIRATDARGCTISQSVTVSGPANPLAYLGDFTVSRPGGTASLSPYSASFSLSGGNYTNYHVTVSAILGTGGSQRITSGSFAGSLFTTTVTLPLTNICLTQPTTWSIQVADNLGCPITQSNIYYYPIQVYESLVRYVTSSLSPLFGPGGFVSSSCTASFVSLYTTASENTGWNNVADGDHVWNNCQLTSQASGSALTSSNLPADIIDGVWNPYGIYYVCGGAPPPTPLNKVYIIGETTCLSGVSTLTNETFVQLESGSYSGPASASTYNYNPTSVGLDPYGFQTLFNWTGSGVSIIGDGTANNTYFSMIPSTSAYNELLSTVYYAAKGTSPSTILSSGTPISWAAASQPAGPGIFYPVPAYQSLPLDSQYDYVIYIEYRTSTDAFC